MITIYIIFHSFKEKFAYLTLSVVFIFQFFNMHSGPTKCPVWNSRLFNSSFTVREVDVENVNCITSAIPEILARCLSHQYDSIPKVCGHVIKNYLGVWFKPNSKPDSVFECNNYLCWWILSINAATKISNNEPKLVT